MDRWATFCGSEHSLSPLSRSAVVMYSRNWGRDGSRRDAADEDSRRNYTRSYSAVLCAAFAPFFLLSVLTLCLLWTCDISPLVLSDILFAC
jgi:hypothetical protein